MRIPGSSRTGRMLPYISKALRSVTLADLSPKPTGVSSGPFSATPLRAMLSSVSCVAPAAMPRLKASAPASASSHSTWAPAAASTCWVARITSGPMPSPGMAVTFTLTRVGDRTGDCIGRESMGCLVLRV